MRDYKAAGSQNSYRPDRDARPLPTWLPRVALAGAALVILGALGWVFLGPDGDVDGDERPNAQLTSAGAPIIPLQLPPAAAQPEASTAESPSER
ncbi:MAG: hypothetical protein PVJ30_09100 [Thiohalocapsa sp.]|jgi:hypothetical protein